MSWELGGADRPGGLIDLIYESMVDPAALQAVVAGVAEATGADSAHLLALPAINAAGFWVGHGIDSGSVEAYERYYARTDCWRAAAPVPPAGTHAVFRGDDLVAPQALLRSEFYNDFLLPNRIEQSVAALISPAAPWSPPYVMAAFRAPGRERFGERDVAVLASVGRHVLRLENLGTAVALSGEAGAHAAFFLGECGRLLQCNKAGGALIVDGIVQAGVRTISFASQSLGLWFHGLVGPGPRLATDSRRHRITVSFPEYGDLEFELFRIERPGPTPVLRAARFVLGVRPAQASATADPFSRVAARRWGLTPSETDIVRRLCAGSTIAEIAHARSSSAETVRSHLKSAKRKTGVCRQVDLVRLALRAASEPPDGD